jgi:phosphoribosylamine---glycine ligase
MNILLLGSGGRECALAWKISQSCCCDKLYIAPGNGGTVAFGENILMSPVDFPKLGEFAISHSIGMIVVGPEDPLVEGIVDFFMSDSSLKNIAVIGPGKEASKLEGSKSFAKAFMNKYNIPTAAYRRFNQEEVEIAKDFIAETNPPYVIKADGLAAGKGVLICSTQNEAFHAIDSILLKKEFGDAGNSIVIEEFLEGIEMSAFVLTDGQHYVLLPEAKDYKRIGDNDTGPNTGGMGTISPVPFADEDFLQKVRTTIIDPTITGIRNENMHYCGFIFFGLMNVKGTPYVIEYNVRLGDPETQSILPRIESDLTDLMLSAWNKALNTTTISILPQTAVNIVLASGGYPGAYEKGKQIHIPSAETNTHIFHAGTTIVDNKLITSGGRVLAACGIGEDIDEAVKRAYKLAHDIRFEKKYFRNDIGNDLKKYK